MKQYLKNHLLTICLIICTNMLLAQNTVMQNRIAEIVAHNPTSPYPLFYFGQGYFFTENFVEAQKHFVKAISLHEQQADFYFFAGLSYEGQEQYEKALCYYDTTITQKYSTEYIIWRGLLRYKTKKYIGAAQDFQAALDDYPDLLSIANLLKDCQKYTGADFMSKDVENNKIIGVIPNTKTSFVEKLIKTYEGIGDMGERYRGLQQFFLNSPTTAMLILNRLLDKQADKELNFFSGLLHEEQGKLPEAVIQYQLAIQQLDRDVLKSRFEVLANYSPASFELLCLQNLRIDYDFQLKKIAEQIGSITPLPPTTPNLPLKGEVRGQNSRYFFQIKPKENKVKDNQVLEYQLDVTNLHADKIMLANIRVEKKHNQLTIKVLHGAKKDGVLWELYPQDYLECKYSSKAIYYTPMGNRLKAVVKKDLNWKKLQSIKPLSTNLYDVLDCATRAYIVACLLP